MTKQRATKKTAYAVLRKYRISKPSLDDLMLLAQKKGFDVLDYSKPLGADATGEIIRELGLTSFANSTYSFAFQKGDIRLLFLCDSLSAEEKIYALAHELGHIFCGHFRSGANEEEVDVMEEHEANEFAHYLLYPRWGEKLILLAAAHKIATCIISVLLICGLLSLPIIRYIQRTSSYYGEYYITESGEKYHKKDCPIIKGKNNTHRMTKEEYDSGKYMPCQICILEN